jgi:hypothetical protein
MGDRAKYEGVKLPKYDEMELSPGEVVVGWPDTKSDPTRVFLTVSIPDKGTEKRSVAVPEGHRYFTYSMRTRTKEKGGGKYILVEFHPI